MDIENYLLQLNKRYRFTHDDFTLLMDLLDASVDDSFESNVSPLSEHSTFDYPTQVETLHSEPTYHTGKAPQFSRKSTRYKTLGLLGTGGMGVVNRVIDCDLERTMAMKVAKSSVMSSQQSLQRFVDEARLTAKLQHPGIIPVHDIGQLKDGRYYFTMQEVEGEHFQNDFRIIGHKMKK